MSDWNVQVAIVGLGPVGAALANLLGAEGVRTLVVDQATAINRAPRAIALDNEALRVLQLAGLPEGSFDTIAIPFVQMHSPVMGDYARANTTGQLDGHPKLVTFFQPQLEEALRARLAERPSVEVWTGATVTALEVGADAVQLTVRVGEEQRRVEASYLVGCDGANSLVRKALGLEFKGRTFEEDWLVVDVKNAPRPIDHVEFHCDPARPAPHMPAPGGRQRWEFKLRPGETREQMERPEVVHRLLHPWTGGAPVELERVAVYRFHARIADRFSVGRAFLAGDAAHLTPPFAGQGLVSGLRDVANLGWKLAAVVQGHAGAAILDTYSVERRPHAAATIDMALLMGRMIMPSSRPQALLVHGLARMLGLFPPTSRLFSELEIKPLNGFAKGLFVPSRGPWTSGTAFPQGLVARGGEVLQSDEALGHGPCLVGLGVDPLARLQPTQRARWQALGGTSLQLTHRGQRLNLGELAPSAEDLTGRFLTGPRTLGWAAVVRPDRMVLCQGPAAEADRLVEETLTVLQVPPSA
jgi:3-(3-hydroxy-phenyl)propionate hydroxylase